MWSSCTDIALGIAGIRRATDLYSTLGTGVDKGEILGNRVNIDNDTNMTYVVTGTGTCEENEVATLQLITGDRQVASILIA